MIDWFFPRIRNYSVVCNVEKWYNRILNEFHVNWFLQNTNTAIKIIDSKFETFETIERAVAKLSSLLSTNLLDFD